jgi:ABC-type glycerol-3-phosphate transport system substrate-binding protein
MKTIAALILLAMLAACGSDYASPFDKPDESAQPVTCAASASCG